MSELKEAARTNFLLMKLLYRNHVRVGMPLSEEDYFKKLEAEFETIFNQREELIKGNNSSKASVSSRTAETTKKRR